MRKKKGFFIYLIDAIFLITLAGILLVGTYFAKILYKPIDVVKNIINI